MHRRFAAQADVVGDVSLIAETFCVRAADRVRRQFEQIEHNDDDRAFAIATSASERTRYHHTV